MTKKNKRQIEKLMSKYPDDFEELMASHMYFKNIFSNTSTVQADKQLISSPITAAHPIEVEAHTSSWMSQPLPFAVMIQPASFFQELYLPMTDLKC